MKNKLIDRFSFLNGHHTKKFLIANIIFATIYFVSIAFFFQHGNNVLFSLLIIGEVFHLWQIIGYCYTVWTPTFQAEFDASFSPAVDVYITVAGEPIAIIEATARAALSMRYDNFSVYLLNDGFVAGKDDWHDVELLADKLNISCITRRTPGGAKAGNINHATRQTDAPYIAIFDADHVPHPEFLQSVMGYFVDPKMGFVQTPQFYNNQTSSGVAQTAWDQQALFFGPLMSGKNRLNAAFMCGTNMVLSRTALADAGGMCEFNIAEDFLTSLFMHEKGWKSVYVAKVLAEGLAPEDFLSYYKQQYRWTRGSLEVIFKYNPLFRRGLSWPQKIQYLSSASYYLSGIVVLIDALIPVVYLFTGITAVTTSSMTLAFIFLPYIFLNLYILQMTSNHTYSYKAISFSISSFYLQIRAVIGVVLNQKTSFAVTSKQAIQGNFLYLVTPQLIYIGLAMIGGVIAFYRDGLSASLLANAAWVLVNIVAFLPFILAARPARRPLSFKYILGFAPASVVASNDEGRKS
ncbi:MAG: glycosyltransferase [Candidatus Saccharimonadales bacterium]